VVDSHILEDRIQFALGASARAEQLVLRYFLNADLQVDLKADQSPVTAADRGAEELLRRELLRVYPNDSVLGEEFGETAGTSGFRWILDPIDGTKSFVHGVPLFGMLVGLQWQGESAGGICRLPGVREVVFAWRGGGAWWEREGTPKVPAKVSSTARLEDALFCFTAVEGFSQIGRTDVLQELSSRCRLSRGWGDCYGHMLVATGRADLMVDPLLEEWDAAALIPIIEEAGGCFMDWTGQSTARGGNGISVIPALRKDLTEIINSR
jgi:histidinol phosphatase-like enzyme (inositol monophosphatase family)